MIQHYINENKPNNIAELSQTFTQEIKESNLFVSAQKAKENRQGIDRHFLGNEDV